MSTDEDTQMHIIYTRKYARTTNNKETPAYIYRQLTYTNEVNWLQMRTMLQGVTDQETYQGGQT